MLVFANLSAFWWLFALAAAVCAYMFKRKLKTRVVSSLMFYNRAWVQTSTGKRFSRLRFSFVLAVEILILTLLVMALAKPMLRACKKKAEAVLILDSSLSMSAQYNGQSAQDRAAEYIKKNLFTLDYAVFTLITAGETPQILGKEGMSAKDGLVCLKNWRCSAPLADINSALALAGEISKKDAEIFVFTDEESPYKAHSPVNWLCFGHALNNVGITFLSRINLGAKDLCLIEAKSFSRHEQGLDIRVLNADTNALIKSEVGVIEANGFKRFRFFTPEIDAPLKISIGQDAAEYDNTAFLLPAKKKPLRVKIISDSNEFISLMKKTVYSSEIAVEADIEPELVITDNQSALGPNGAWVFAVNKPQNPIMLKGAVVANKEHPLLFGLPKLKTAWAVDKSFKSAGQTIMSINGLQLLCVHKRQDGGLTVALNIALNYSRLHQTTAWPILFWNLFNLRMCHRYGLSDINTSCGADVNVFLPAGLKSFEVVGPSGRMVKQPLYMGKAVFKPIEAGVYTIKGGSAEYKIAANLNSAAESDLKNKCSKAPKHKLSAVLSRHCFESQGHWFILASIILLMLHLWLLKGQNGGINV